MSGPRIRIVSAKTRAFDPTDPLTTARAYAQERHHYQGHLSLRHQGGLFYRYTKHTYYRASEESSVRADLYRYLARAIKAGSGEAFKPSSAKVSDVIDALRAETHLPLSDHAPCWVDEATGANPYDLLPCANGLLHLPTRTLHAATSQFFTTNGVDFAYDATASLPHQWLEFLLTLWPDDAESQETLQEWMGYCLTMRTHFQKMLLMVGPKRSGKGTIGRVMRKLIGETHTVGPMLSNLAEQFGLAVLIDKPVAIVADARLSGRADAAVLAERLLSISGEDTLSIPRKHLPDWTGALPTRFTLLTNELPRIEDSSGALSSRFIVLLLKQSFYGREDHALASKLYTELPSILNWALDGLARLLVRGRFVQPASSAAVIQEFEDLGSPINAFLRQEVVAMAGLRVSQQRLYNAWKRWCRDAGRDHPGTIQIFARNLRSTLPFVGDARPSIDGDRVRVFEGLGLRDERSGDD